MRTGWPLLALTALVACSARPPTTVAIAAPPAARAAVLPPGAPQPAAAPAAASSDAPLDETDEDEGARGEYGAPSDDRGWLGVELEPAAPDELGARIARVVPKSPADRDGLLPGDLVLRIGSQPVASPSDVVGIVSHQAAGTRLGIALRRKDAERLVAVTLGAAPERDEIYRMSFVDQPAPAFEQLQTANGSFTPTLGAQRGQVVVIEFWAPWCVACRALIPHMNQWHAQYAARGVRVVGITAEPVARAAAAAKDLGMEYPVAADESGRTTMAYQARAIPTVFVIDKTGNVRDVMVGYDAVHLPKLEALVRRLIAER